MADQQAAQDAYFMRIAESVAAGTDCTFTKVGAVMVRGDAVLSAGHLGTPTGVAPCSEGGCAACAAGQHLTLLCTCIHAEASAIHQAARNGIALEGATCYGTHKPCLECLKQLIQSGAKRCVFVAARQRDAEYWRVYDEVARAAGMRVDKLAGAP